MGLVDDHPHKWPAPLQALEHRTFRWLWIATFVSNAGSWMQRMATAWLVYTLSESETWLGVDAAMTALPTFLLLPFSGVLADRIDRRIVLVLANLSNALLAMVLAMIWWSGNLAIWHLLISSFLTAIVAAIAAPASQSIVPTAAGEDHVPNAVALNSFQYNLARAVGPAVGGVALGTLGAGWCFLLNALSYVGIVAAVTLLPVTTTAVAHRVSTLESLVEGFRFIRRNAKLQRSLLLVSILAFGGAPMVTLLPVIAKSVLNSGTDGYSILLTGFGVGAALSGVLLAISPPKNTTAWIIGASFLAGACHLAMPWAHSMPLAVLVAALAGLAFVSAMIELGTDVISVTPDNLRGRISGVQQLCFRFAQPLGGVFAALVARHLEVQFAFVGFGAVLLIGIPIGILSFRIPHVTS